MMAAAGMAATGMAVRTERTNVSRTHGQTVTPAEPVESVRAGVDRSTD